MFLPFSRILLRFDRVTPSEVYFLRNQNWHFRSLQLSNVFQHHCEVLIEPSEYSRKFSVSLRDYRDPCSNALINQLYAYYTWLHIESTKRNNCIWHGQKWKWTSLDLGRSKSVEPEKGWRVQVSQHNRSVPSVALLRQMFLFWQRSKELLDHNES